MIENKSQFESEIIANLGEKSHQIFKGLHYAWPAAKRRFCFLSSFAHVMYEFYFKYRPTYKERVEIWAATVREDNGQMKFWVILQKWIQGDCLKTKGSFMVRRKEKREKESLYSI